MVPESCSGRDAGFFSCNYVASQYRQHGTIHGHGHGHIVQGDVVEEQFHVFHGINGDTGFANVSCDPRMIRVVPPVRGEVKGDRYTVPTAGENPVVEGIGFLGSGKACVLSDGPRPPRVHGGLRALT